MTYILQRDITIPAGTEFKASNELGEGGADTVIDEGGTRVFVSIAWATGDGLIAPADSTSA